MHKIQNAINELLSRLCRFAYITEQKRLWSKIAFPEHESTFVLSLYEKYQDDLRSVRQYQRHFYSKREQIGLSPMLGDMEAEITYLRIRESKPQSVVEISPASGWSTSWILHALKDNGSGTLYSFDLVDDCLKVIPSSLSGERWIFFQGDASKHLNKLPSRIDYLFIDSDHSANFATWYIYNLFPLLQQGTTVSAHDILKFKYESGWGPEATVLCKWLAKKGISCFTASRALKDKGHNDILTLKKNLGLHEVIHPADFNSMIFFTL